MEDMAKCDLIPADEQSTAMSEPPNAFDVLKSSRKKRAHSSQGGGKESNHPRKKQEEAHVSGYVPASDGHQMYFRLESHYVAPLTSDEASSEHF